MRIQHNIPALSAYRNYTTNVSGVNKNLEKLSSGYKINRAGDDAAGLAISEKMRLQISGLEQAQNNAKSGINLVQTAEGALAEVHDMLNRMYTLAEQSANGTYADDVDREQLQKEVNQLRTEIDRIADSANFNGINLLDGALDGSTTTSGATDVTLANFRDGQLGKEPQAGVYSIDLSNVKMSDSSDTAGNGAITVFGLDLNLDTLTAGKTLEGEELAKQIVAKFNALGTTGTNDRKISGAIITAEQQGAKVVFSMDKAPTEAWTTSSGNTQLTLVTNSGNNGAQEYAMTVEKDAVDSTQGRMYGKATFDLTTAMVSDGKALTIGDTTYTFAVGKDSKFKGGANVIDMTDYETIAEADLKVAARRLSTAAKDNKNFKVGSVLTGATIYLTEKEGGVDYSKNNLAGDDSKYGGEGSNAAGATHWKGLVTIGDATAKGKALSLQIGDTSDAFNKMAVSVKDMHAAAMGIGEIDISTQDGASKAMDAIKNATNYVSDVRGDLGALQNRLDHTIKNLSVTQENITDAESTIRDVDIAKEMMSYTKNNILVQSAQAMLAQANQLPQGVLQLLG